MLCNSIFHLATMAISLLDGVHSAPRTFLVEERDVAFTYNDQKVRGVNLGGWFVLEPWITPSLFNYGEEVIDEYTYTKALGKEAATQSLEAHWNNWIVEDDFKQIAKAGLNHVRIPIGYWAVAPLEGEPYVQGQLPFLDKAVGWARSAGLKVWLDLHGAPGSQNGFDNSGRNGSINWLKGSTSQQTVAAIAALSARYAAHTDTVTAIELINEPFSYQLPLSGIKSYYEAGYAAVSKCSDSFATVIHDAFLPLEQWNGFLAPQSTGHGQNVLLDTHQYQIFNRTMLAWSLPEHIETACASIIPAIKSTDKWTVVGEWTASMTDCTQWLNGRGKGARYDGTLPGYEKNKVGPCAGYMYQGTMEQVPEAKRKELRRFVEAQLDAYEAHTGWFFWTWRTESSPEWDMRQLLGAGVFPQPLTIREFPRQCM